MVGRELKALQQVDLEMADNLKRRKKNQSGMDEIVAAIEGLEPPKCSECSVMTSRLFCCLQCCFTGCWKDCAQRHFGEHKFFMEFNNMVIWCLECNDYIFHDWMDQIVWSEQYNLDYIVSRIRGRLKS